MIGGGGGGSGNEKKKSRKKAYLTFRKRTYMHHFVAHSPSPSAVFLNLRLGNGVPLTINPFLKGVPRAS